MMDLHHHRRFAQRLAIVIALAITADPVFASDSVALLTDAVPPDAAIVYINAKPEWVASMDATGSSLALAALVIDRAQRIGLLAQVDESVRCWLDFAVAASVAGNYPHLLALLDVKARARKDGGHELAGLHGALVLHVGTDVARIERQIQHILSTYTNTAESKLIAADGSPRSRFKLSDRRLPPWAVIEWGPVDDLYVVTIGEGAFDRVLQTIRGGAPALTTEAWFAEARARTEGHAASHLLLMRFDALRAAGDEAFTGKLRSVQTVLELDGVDRGLWTARRDGRSGEVLSLIQRDGKDVQTAIAGNRFLGEIGPGVIPDGATRYVVFRCEPATAVRTLAKAYLLSRSPDARRDSGVFWRSLQKEAGVSFDNDIFAHLGPRIVMHDHPRHALDLSLARTFLFPITGNADALRDPIDQLFHHLARSDQLPPFPRLLRDPDGVWYLFAGLAGPALTVTEDWLVLSFSPRAVREVVEGLCPKPHSVASDPCALDDDDR